MSEQANPDEVIDPFKPYKNRFTDNHKLPAKGRDKEEILSELAVMADEENARWLNGKVSGTFYHAGKEHREFLNRAFSFFSHVNTLQFDLCPSLFKMESEVISMTARMLHADAVKEYNAEDEVCGTMTSGGSESILMAMKSYRDLAAREKGIDAPEIIMSNTAHPAFDKAGAYFGIRMVHAPVEEPDYRVDPQTVRSLITPNTIAIVASAGNYPYGLIDPFEELSEIALENNLGLHVDGCLGGFILPWFEKLGREIPCFDFRLRGVTSISADTHKFGYALKGTSVVLYRNNRLRHSQYFNVPDWPGGMYASPTAAGSRSGGLTAATWASMMYLGEEGYMKCARAIMTVADEMIEGVRGIPELTLIGDPTFVISFRSDDVDVYHVNDFMKTRGWRFNCLQLPPAMHFCVTLPQTMVPGLAAQFASDLKEGVVYARENEGKTAETSALYGVAGNLEGNRLVTDMIFGLFDHLYSV